MADWGQKSLHNARENTQMLLLHTHRHAHTHFGPRTSEMNLAPLTLSLTQSYILKFPADARWFNVIIYSPNPRERFHRPETGLNTQRVARRNK